jgi:hypothetical protein
MISISGNMTMQYWLDHCEFKRLSKYLIKRCYENVGKPIRN